MYVMYAQECVGFCACMYTKMCRLEQYYTILKTDVHIPQDGISPGPAVLELS